MTLAPVFPDASLARTLSEIGPDFVATWMAVKNLSYRLKDEPGLLGPATLTPLAAVLMDDSHDAQPHARILFREAAACLARVFEADPGSPHAGLSCRALRRVLLERRGKARLAVAEVLGGLPVTLPGPDIRPEDPALAPEVSLSDIFRLAGGEPRSFTTAGRSLLVRLRGRAELLVVKLARSGEDPAGLALEAAWLSHLAAAGDLGARFDLPVPLRPAGRAVVRLSAPPPGLRRKSLSPEGYALAYLAPADYFAYPNDDRPGRRPEPEAFAEMLSRAAFLLGRLAGRGIVHTAPIPLFHNRTQAHRRDDHGLYEWHRLGRLDRWLDSCRHPNFGATGLRDFEHLESRRRSGRALYQAVGAHLLSLLLVAGSWFRAAAPGRVGLAPDGTPIDARDLFDAPFLTALVENVFRAYHRGFVGADPAGLPLDAQALAGRMIEEMGVDRHMREVLRVHDQTAMSREAFEAFLTERGIRPEAARAMQKDAADIPLTTGPHLGGFNQQISLPEMIEFVAASAASIIAARFAVEAGNS